MVSAFFKGGGTLSGFHGKRIALGAVRAEKNIPQAVKPVRIKVRGEKLISAVLIEKIVLNHAVPVPASRCIQAHLEILVVHRDMMEAEFQIRKYGKMPFLHPGIPEADIPDLNGIILRDKQRLGSIDLAVIAEIRSESIFLSIHIQFCPTRENFTESRLYSSGVPYSVRIKVSVLQKRKNIEKFKKL